MPKNYCIMQIWAESGKSALPICNYSQILYQFLTFTQNLKRSPSPFCEVLILFLQYRTHPDNCGLHFLLGLYVRHRNSSH